MNTKPKIYKREPFSFHNHTLTRIKQSKARKKYIKGLSFPLFGLLQARLRLNCKTFQIGCFAKDWKYSFKKRVFHKKIKSNIDFLNSSPFFKPIALVGSQSFFKDKKEKQMHASKRDQVTGFKTERQTTKWRKRQYLDRW